MAPPSVAAYGKQRERCSRQRWAPEGTSSAQGSFGPTAHGLVLHPVEPVHCELDHQRDGFGGALVLEVVQRVQET